MSLPGVILSPIEDHERCRCSFSLQPGRPRSWDRCWTEVRGRHRPLYRGVHRVAEVRGLPLGRAAAGGDEAVPAGQILVGAGRSEGAHTVEQFAYGSALYVGVLHDE